MNEVCEPMIEQNEQWRRGRVSRVPTGLRQPGQVALSFAMLVAAIALGGLLLQGPVRPPWQSQAPELETTTITVGEQTLTVELAAEPAARARGLGYRAGLAPGTGMLFVFEEPAVRSFWMKGMRFCLDIIWIEGGQIVGAAESVCPEPAGTADADLPTYASGVPVGYVLEVPAGWLDAHGYGAGTRVSIDLS